MVVIPNSQTCLLATSLLATLIPQAAAIPATNSPLQVPAFQSEGCFSEPPKSRGRALAGANTRSDDMTAEACAAFCSSYKYFGTEYSHECYSANALTEGTEEADGDCTMACGGDSSQMCGAGDRLSVYHNIDYLEVTVATVAAWNYIACTVDHVGDRVFPHRRTVRDDMTVYQCASICSDYEFFGVEFGSECYCGRSFLGEIVDANQCGKPCAGDSSAICGDGDRLTVYASTTIASSYEDIVGDY